MFVQDDRSDGMNLGSREGSQEPGSKVKGAQWTMTVTGETGGWAAIQINQELKMPGHLPRQVPDTPSKFPFGFPCP